MSTAGPLSPRPVRAPVSGPSAADLTPAVGLVPAPPIPARSRLRGTPSTLSLAGKRDSPAPSVNSTNNTTPTPRTPAPLLVSSPSDSSIGSTASSSRSTPTSGSGYASASLPSVSSPGVPITPGTPPVHARKQSGGWKFGSMSRSSVSGSGTGNSHGRKVSGPYSPSGPQGESGFGDYLQSGSANAAPAQTGWPGQLQEAQTSPASPLSASQKRSRFSRASRHSSSGSVSLSAASDPLRIKDGVAPRGSSSGVYTPPTFPGPSPRPSYSQNSSSYASTATLPTMLPAPGQAFRSASGSSDASTSDSSSVSIPQTPTSPSAAASRMYNACVGAFSSWSITSGSGSSSNGGKRASQPAKSVSTPYSPVHLEHGPMSANAAYFPTQAHRTPSYSASAQDPQLVGKHHTSRSVSYTQSQAQVPVQVWSPSTGWTEAGAEAAGLGVGVEQEGNYAQGLSRSNTSATLGKMITLGEAPKGRRKPVPRPQQEAEEVHAL